MKRAAIVIYFVILAATDLISQSIDPAPGPSILPQCTSFCLDNNGYAVFGSNFDYPKDISEGLIFVNKRNVSKSLLESDSLRKHVCWTTKYGSVSFNLVTSQAAFAGMNEAGLVISLMGLRDSKCPEPDRRPWIHSYFWLKYVLDNFSTVAEVIASDSTMRIIGRVPPYCAPHYLISDKNGNCATIEFLNRKMVAHSGKNLPVKVLANTNYDHSISEWNKISVLKKKGKPVPVMIPSLRRFTRAADRVSAYKPTDSLSAIHTAFDILEEVSGQKINGGPTRWSMVFDTKNLRIHFKTIIHPVIREIDLQKLDFSCETPVKMMDINEKLSGDITDQLKDYSFKLHLDHALNARKKWGMEESPEELVQQIRVFDAFPCHDNAVLKHPYLGQKPPGTTPEIFAPGIVSTGLDELNSVFSPDGSEFYFCVRKPGAVSIFQIKIENGIWSKPALLPFASRFGDIDISLSLDGSKLFFSSKRSVSEKTDPKSDYDFWMVDRVAKAWGKPIHLGTEINSDRDDFYPMMTNDGTLCFSSQREGPGTNNIYRSKLVNGHYVAAERLDSTINSAYRDFDPYISPDESLLIFASARPDGFGAEDLYISFRKEDGTWTPAKNMGDKINSPGSEYCPMLSPDGKFLFFTGVRRT